MAENPVACTEQKEETHQKSGGYGWAWKNPHGGENRGGTREGFPPAGLLGKMVQQGHARVEKHAVERQIEMGLPVVRAHVLVT